MSTLKVATIQDTSGNNSSTPSQVAQGRAKAWVNFNGENTVAIRDSFNVSSLTDNGTGNYTVNFSTAMANANYVFVGFQNSAPSRAGIFGSDDSTVSNFQTTSALVITSYESGTNGQVGLMDPEYVHCAFFGA